MNYGRFFRLNTHKSDLSRGIAIFDYIWLKDDDAHHSEKTPEYPVYVVFTKDCIEFKCHFYALALNKNEEIHLHNNILSLPLSANLEVKDGLTNALTEGYNTAFPSIDNKYLCLLLIQTIASHPVCMEDDEHKKDKDQKNRYLDSQQEASTYFDLIIFKIPNEASFKEIKDNNKKEAEEIYEKLKAEKKIINWFIRKLILDFLFDLEHTKVFQNSPFYEYTSVKLKENFFFNALSNKAKYYYYRRVAKKRENPKKKSFTLKLKQLISDCKCRKIFYKTKKRTIEKGKRTKKKSFFRKLKQLISLYKHRKLFYEIKKNAYIQKLFFLKEYFLPSEEQWIKSIIDARADHYFTIEQGGWFNNPEDELNDIYKKNSVNGIMLCKEIQKKKCITEYLKIILRKIQCGEGKKTQEEIIKTKVKKITKIASQWQLKKYDFRHALPYSLWFFLLPIILSITSFCYLKGQFLSKEEVWCVLWPILPLFIVTISFFVEIKIRYKLNYSWGNHFLLFRLFGTIVVGWLTIAFASNILPQFYAIVFEGELLLKNLGIIAILLFLTAIFVYDGVSHEVPYLNRCRKFGRTAQLMIIAFCYSYITGIFVTALIGTETIKLSDKYDYYITHSINTDTVHISPGFLFVFTFVAMFIGLFINRIFEDKKIVDSE
jgi:hypothetical protein